MDHPGAAAGGGGAAALHHDRQDPADGGGDLPHPDRGHRGRDSVRGRADHVHVQHAAAGLQPGVLRQGLPHLPHPLLGLPDHPGLHPQPLLHHLLGPSVGQATGTALLLPLPAAGTGRPRNQEDQDGQRGAGTQPRGGLQGGTRLPGGEGAARPAAAAPPQLQSQAPRGHLPFLHHPGGLPQRPGDRLPGRAVFPLRIQRAGHLRVRSLPLRQGGGVLRLAAHREDRFPGLHVRRQRRLRPPQPGRAQPLGLAQGQGRCPGGASASQVAGGGAQEGPFPPSPCTWPDAVQRVRLCLSRGDGAAHTPSPPNRRGPPSPPPVCRKG